MKGFAPLLLGLFGTFAFSWLGLTVIPNAQIGHLDPQSDEDRTDVYPMVQSGMAARGRHVYVGNGCIYCHSQWIRADYIASDIDRKWGDRRSAPRDYLYDRPVLLGKMRLGPDLSNIGKRAPAEDAAAPSPGASPAGSPAPAAAPATAAAIAPNKSPAAPAVAAVPVASPGQSPAVTAAAATPDNNNGQPPLYSAAWHHLHLYSPRSLNRDSNMPAFRYLYEKRRISGQRSADALQLDAGEAPPEGYEVVPTYDAQCLVAFLMSLDQSHPLNELRGAAAPAAAPSASAAPVAPVTEAKK
jgi:cytochrome c oxidase cbb3-type subunit 2